MKNWKQILNEVGLVPPEQTMRDQEELIAHIGEPEFCKEYLTVAHKCNPSSVEGLILCAREYICGMNGKKRKDYIRWMM